jgi:hypothetical protein
VGESEHFTIIYDGVVSQSYVNNEMKVLVNELESAFQFITTNLQFIPPFCQTDKKYKTLVNIDPDLNGAVGGGTNVPGMGKLEVEPKAWDDKSTLVSTLIL